MGSAQLNSPAAVYPVFSTAGDARLSRARFEATASFIERVTDLAAVMSATFLSYFAYRSSGHWQGSSLFRWHGFDSGSRVCGCVCAHARSRWRL